MKFQGKLAYHCQKQLNTDGGKKKKIPYARTIRNNKQKQTYKDFCFSYVRTQRENSKTLLKGIKEKLKR